MKYLYLIVGKSGSGKSTIINRYCEKYGAKQLLSYTTRRVRADEEVNPTHTHVSSGEFTEMMNDMVAYTSINGYHYGATKQMCLDSDFYVIDKNGIEYFLNNCKDIPYKIIGVETRDDISYSRMCRRDGKVKAYERFVYDRDTSYELDFDFKIKNNTENDIDEVVDVLYTYIQQKEKEN